MKLRTRFCPFALFRMRSFARWLCLFVLFGSFLAWAVYDRISLKRRTDPGAPPIPVGGWKNDAVALLVGTLVYLALGFAFHPIVIGVPVLGQ